MTIIRRVREATSLFRRNRGTLILKASPNPHLRMRDPFDRIMADVVIALIPVLAGAIYLFGLRVAVLCLTSVATAVVLDRVCRRVRGRRYVFDFSAVITGLLLALSLPAGVPLFFAPLGAAVAIVLAKELFGGLGRNLLNPAIAGRMVLHLVFATAMGENAWPREGIAVPPAVDAVSGATVLAIAKEGEAVKGEVLWASFLGNEGGASGETSAVLILLGAAWLFHRRVITWRIPFSLLATMAFIAWVSGAVQGMSLSGGFQTLLAHILGGGALLVAFFMATDYSTSPATPLGQLVYGAGIGAVTMAFRLGGWHPEGVMFALFFMNLTVPLINHLTLPRVLGERKRRTGLTFRWVWDG